MRAATLSNTVCLRNRRSVTVSAAPPTPPSERPTNRYTTDGSRSERYARAGSTAELRATIVRRLLRTLDSDIAEDRAVNAAARTLVYADLGDRRLALAQQIHADRLYTAARASAGADASSAEPIDPAIHDWYATSCPCGLPPGECKIHPRARASQRPPPGDWRVWAYIAGRGSGKTRAGAEWIQHRVETGEMRLGSLYRADRERDPRRSRRRPVGHPRHCLAAMAADLFCLYATADLAEWSLGRLPERRGAGASPRQKHRYDLGRRARCVATSTRRLG